jgi:hypothetical protein
MILAEENDVAIRLEDEIAIACADCPNCGEENLVARVAEVTCVRFTSPAVRKVTCRDCRKSFKLPEHRLLIRRKLRGEVESEYPIETHLWME